MTAFGLESPRRRAMEWEEEESWLRRRVIRLRTILRFTKDARVATGLKEFVAEAEDRVEMLGSRLKQNTK
jgi:hypothetical protein